jgi:hypothetical protein
LDVEQRYLNISLWAYPTDSPSTTDEKATPQRQRVLLAYGSLSSFVCLVTIHSYSQHNWWLKCYTTVGVRYQIHINKHFRCGQVAGHASQVTNSLFISHVYIVALAEYADLAAHPGFDARLCHGTITLAFQWSQQPPTETTRKCLFIFVIYYR